MTTHAQNLEKTKRENTTKYRKAAGSTDNNGNLFPEDTQKFAGFARGG